HAGQGAGRARAADTGGLRLHRASGARGRAFRGRSRSAARRAMGSAAGRLARRRQLPPARTDHRALMSLAADILADLPSGMGAGCCSGAALEVSRQAVPAEPEPAADFAAYVTTAQDGTHSLELLVEGMHCAGCIRAIEGALKAFPEVTFARVNLTGHRLAVRWDGG